MQRAMVHIRAVIAVNHWVGLRWGSARAARMAEYHGHSGTRNGFPKTPTYQSWQHMKDRCYNPRNEFYQHYGRRGIIVCDRWKGSFLSFLKDMGERPEGMTIDRIDPNGNYEPENCRWANGHDQRLNQRNQRLNRRKRARRNSARRTGGRRSDD